ncbi:hypothetical protein C2869_00255 [Saccharobesus litoralis]|uniref:Cell division inhibitor SulA n=1 Tax=Saccharobesus litoralis TaxID=2172099 RepID=A0A2S0VLA2_9ALTE|nr:SulA-like leucine-rich domain-containing protein [Saccharobesus litoralis]AWB64965.1 hypothetical protein C2869_00255 [Saccharobesus litoralis]
MNTYIAMRPAQQTRYFATNNKSSDFSLRFWQSIAKTQEHNRWLCLIAPSDMPSKSELISAGINVERMLVVHTQTDKQAFQSACQALKLGKCAAVVTWLGCLSEAQKQQMQVAANLGNSTSLLIKSSFPQKLVA